MMELIIIAVLAFAVGYKVSGIIHTLSFQKILKDLGVTDQQLTKLAENHGLLTEDDSKDSRIAEYEITIEQHGDQLYAFKTDGEFVAQGPDQEALINRIAERYKNVKFTVRQGKEYLTKTQG